MSQVRYAVVGLGHIAQRAVLPAFANTSRSSLAAIVSGDRAKLDAIGTRYGVEHRALYTDYGALMESGAVDAVYIALPNHLHAEYAISAAARGVHVLCEKPLAISVGECERMIDAANVGGVLLMTAYRLHFEPANLEARRIVAAGEIGEPRMFESVFSFRASTSDVRLVRAKGGGTLFDIGIYCINAARHLFGGEPIDVCATSITSKDPRFAEIDEMTSAILRFPNDRLATFTSSFGAAPSAWFRVTGTEGSVALDPAYFYRDELRLFVTRDRVTTPRVFPARDQFAEELDHFSRCILEGRDPIPDGAEGRADVRVIEAALKSTLTRKFERLA